MDNLQRYLLEHSDVTMDDDRPDSADMCFLKVVLLGAPSARPLRELIEGRVAPGLTLNLFDNQEHGYIEIGAWLDSQELALRLMGMGTLLGLWQLLTPKTVLGAAATPEQVQELAGMGMVTILAGREGQGE